MFENVGVPIRVRNLAVLIPAPMCSPVAIDSEIVKLFVTCVAKAVLLACDFSSHVAPNLVFEADAVRQRASPVVLWPRRSTRRYVSKIPIAPSALLLNSGVWFHIHQHIYCRPDSVGAYA